MNLYKEQERTFVERIRYLCDEIKRAQADRQVALHTELEAVLIEFEQYKRTQEPSKNSAWRLFAPNI